VDVGRKDPDIEATAPDSAGGSRPVNPWFRVVIGPAARQSASASVRQIINLLLPHWSKCPRDPCSCRRSQYLNVGGHGVNRTQ